MASFKAKFPVLQELLAKNHRGGLWPPPPAGRGLKEECHLLDTKRFSQEQPHLNAAPKSIFRYSCPVTHNRLPKLNFDAINSAANDLYLCCLFRRCCHLSINLTTSCQYTPFCTPNRHLFISIRHIAIDFVTLILVWKVGDLF